MNQRSHVGPLCVGQLKKKQKNITFWSCLLKVSRFKAFTAASFIYFLLFFKLLNPFWVHWEAAEGRLQPYVGIWGFTTLLMGTTAVVL